MVEMMNNQEWSSSSTPVDVSSFLLFESTGDSEFDSNFYSTNDPMDSFTLNPSHQRFLEDDDAQSCSYECGVVHVDDEDMELDFQIENDDDDDDDDDDADADADVDSSSWSRAFNRKSVRWNSDMEDDEDEGGVVEQRWMNGVNRCKKSKSNVSSVVDSELKSQKDKDRLFWETCLAS